MNRARTDVNFDATALARYEPDLWSTFEGGYAMKTRSPTLYERYAWSNNTMAMSMNGWFGDGNGYVGNPDLKPETANTLSYTAGWHDSARKDWELKITPYYTYVEDYIDVNRCAVPATTTPPTTMMACTKANLTNTTGYCGSAIRQPRRRDVRRRHFGPDARWPPARNTANSRCRALPAMSTAGTSTPATVSTT